MHYRSVGVFKEFVSGIDASGGGDCAEDVMGGLKAVAKLTWRDGVLTKVGQSSCSSDSTGSLSFDIAMCARNCIGIVLTGVNG